MNNRYIILIILIIGIIGAIFYLDRQKTSVNNTSSNEKELIDSTKPLFKTIKGVDYPLASELIGISGYLTTAIARFCL